MSPGMILTALSKGPGANFSPWALRAGSWSEPSPGCIRSAACGADLIASRKSKTRSCRTLLLRGSGTICISFVENFMVAYSLASWASWEKMFLTFSQYAAFLFRLFTTFGNSSRKSVEMRMDETATGRM